MEKYAAETRQFYEPFFAVAGRGGMFDLFGLDLGLYLIPVTDRRYWIALLALVLMLLTVLL